MRCFREEIRRRFAARFELQEDDVSGGCYLGRTAAVGGRTFACDREGRRIVLALGCPLTTTGAAPLAGAEWSGWRDGASPRPVERKRVDICAAGRAGSRKKKNTGGAASLRLAVLRSRAVSCPCDDDLNERSAAVWRAGKGERTRREEGRGELRDETTNFDTEWHEPFPDDRRAPSACSAEKWVPRRVAALGVRFGSARCNFADARLQPSNLISTYFPLFRREALP